MLVMEDETEKNFSVDMCRVSSLFPHVQRDVFKCSSLKRDNMGTVHPPPSSYSVLFFNDADNKHFIIIFFSSLALFRSSSLFEWSDKSSKSTRIMA